jgi:hypothetical protein
MGAVLEALGLILIVVGVGLIYLPAALIVAGLIIFTAVHLPTKGVSE